MSDASSSLLGRYVPAQSGVGREAGLIFSEVRRFALTQLAAWPQTLSRMAAEVARLSGTAEAPGPGKSVKGSRVQILRVEPLKWWLIRDPGLVLGPLADRDSGEMLDLSASRLQLGIEGPAAEKLLGHFLPIDLRPRAFPEGSVATTAFHQTGVVLWRTAQGFSLLLPRSYAASLWNQLAESARQYGFAIR